jgi:Bcr/CflA subfamily drug resistance transporter
MVFYIILLSGLGTLGYFGADMYLPAFPELQTYFGTTATAIGLTFSVYMFGITIGQLFYGTLSDRFGRTKTLMSGLSLFVIATIGCMFSDHIYELIAWRALQALGACSAMVIWQAIVIDKFSPEKNRTIFSIVFPMLAISPALAPSIGGAIVSIFSWQVIFILLALMGLTLLLCVLFFLTETTTHSTRANAKINYVDIRKKYATLLRSPDYMGYVCTLALTSSAYFCYLTASPFILELMGYDAVFIGLSYIPQTIAFVLGGLFSKKIIDALGIAIMRFCLYAFIFFAVVFFVATILWPLTNAWQIIIPFAFMAFLNGILYPSGMSLALNKFPQLAGTAAGLSGSIQAFTAFATTSIVSALLFAGIISLSVMIVVLAIAGGICFLTLVKSP